MLCTSLIDFTERHALIAILTNSVLAGKESVFPNFMAWSPRCQDLGFLLDMPKRRAVVLEAIRPELRSRRILAEGVPSFREDPSGMNPGQ
ncbi:hypothetical protein BDV30DRAFT_201501 [Aspergillus minisclerotigenes]|uniref:Uncharacterized protein n=1 Tax=Aspergillus minisclerotigenes TaxID=656917 RepID=A0A5N6JNP0_9EURO|nr:hypothetical protein BDV30DRAFT_201501 [Aspergillus minisclerotigenes]